jgi:hypothetical protein
MHQIHYIHYKIGVRFARGWDRGLFFLALQVDVDIGLQMSVRRGYLGAWYGMDGVDYTWRDVTR